MFKFRNFNTFTPAQAIGGTHFEDSNHPPPHSKTYQNLPRRERIKYHAHSIRYFMKRWLNKVKIVNYVNYSIIIKWYLQISFYFENKFNQNCLSLRQIAWTFHAVIYVLKLDLFFKFWSFFAKRTRYVAFSETKYRGA